MLYFNETPHDPFTLDIYPYGNSSFKLYEDDGVTRAALEGNAFANTLISVSGPENISHANITIQIGATNGTYTGTTCPQKVICYFTTYECRATSESKLFLTSSFARKATPTDCCFYWWRQNSTISKPVGADCNFNFTCDYIVNLPDHPWTITSMVGSCNRSIQILMYHHNEQQHMLSFHPTLCQKNVWFSLQNMHLPFPIIPF